MDAALAALLDELYAAGREHDAQQADRLARLRNLEPETGELLALLVRATGAQRVLELGTSNGYSTLWLAAAVRDTGGTVTSVELVETLETTVVPVGAGLRLAVTAAERA
jgi:predicted O-methyltransferase YrrM